MDMKKNWWVVLLLILFGIAFLISVCGGNSSGNSGNSGYQSLSQSKPRKGNTLKGVDVLRGSYSS